jgi:hypothetical protein
MQDSTCRGLLFTSFLIKPVQRICKYPLFIKDLIKYTPEDHDDYKLLVEAEGKVNEVVLAVNEYKRAMESLQYVLELADAIEGIENLVVPGRRFVIEFEANIVEPHISESLQKTRHVILFTDLLLITKQRKHNKKITYTLKGKVSMESAKLVYLAEETFGKYGLEVTENTESYYMFFQSLAEYEKYGKTVREAFLTLKKITFARSQQSSMSLLTS